MSRRTGVCVVCGKESTLVCSRCEGGYDINGAIQPSTVYCSKDCQTKDFPIHKATICRFANARKQLYRGAALLQDVFYLFREATFEHDIQKAQWEDDEKIHLLLRSPRSKEWPVHDLPETFQLNNDFKRTVLSWRASNFAAAFVVGLVKKVLEGITDPNSPPMETAVEFQHFYGNIKVLGHGEDGMRDGRIHEHVVIRVKLIDGEHYVIDMAGAQFGQYRAVMHANEYAFHFHKVLGAKPLGSWWSFWNGYVDTQEAEPELPENFAYMVVAVAHSVAGAISIAWEGHEKREGMSIANICRANDEMFGKGKSTMLDGLKKDMPRVLEALQHTLRHLEDMADDFVQMAWAPIKTSQIPEVSDTMKMPGEELPEYLAIMDFHKDARVYWSSAVR